MFGLTEITDLLVSSNNQYDSFQMGIVPTILLPLAFLSTGISIVATFIASLFGVELKAEGPKKLLEILLRPKVLISALILNGVIYGGFHLYEYLKNGPYPDFYVQLKNNDIAFNKKASLSSDGWTQNLEEGIFARGYIHGSELFVGGIDGNLFVLDNETGKIKNKIFFGKFLSPSPIFFDNHLFFGEGLHESHDMHIYKFNPSTKTVVASLQTKGHTEIYPVISQIEDKSILFQSAGGDGLYAIDPNTMKPLWHYVDGHMDAFTLVHNKHVYIASGIPEEEIGVKRPFAYKIDALSGNLVWKKELPLSSWYGPILVQNNICFIQGEIHVTSNVGGIVCFDEEGKRAQSLVIDNPIIGKPIVKDHMVYFNDYYGDLYAWNAKSNMISWKLSFDLKNGSYSSMQWFNENVIIHALSDGRILFVNIEDGKILREEKFPAKEKVYSDALIQGDNIYIFGMGGSIFKKKISGL